MRVSMKRRPYVKSGLAVHCVGGTGHSASRELAAIWIAEGIESVVFPSVTGAGRNVVVYLANAGAGSVAVRNRNEVLTTLRRLRVRKRVR
jgi:hypothetical protein